MQALQYFSGRDLSSPLPALPALLAALCTLLMLSFHAAARIPTPIDALMTWRHSAVLQPPPPTTWALWGRHPSASITQQLGMALHSSPAPPSSLRSTQPHGSGVLGTQCHPPLQRRQRCAHAQSQTCVLAELQSLLSLLWGSNKDPKVVAERNGELGQITPIPNTCSTPSTPAALGQGWDCTEFLTSG